MNKFIICLAFIFAAVALVADASLSLFHKDKTPEAIDVDHFGSMDVIENGVPVYAKARDEPCAKNKTPASCNECCVSHGFVKGYHPARFERLVARGVHALTSHCTCVVDSIIDE